MRNCIIKIFPLATKQNTRQILILTYQQMNCEFKYINSKFSKNHLHTKGLEESMGISIPM